MGESPDILVAVIDDDASVCRSLCRLLKASGIRSMQYASAEAFLADANKPSFDCLVVDIQLEGMSGIQMNLHLSASGSTTPVIFITAHDGSTIRDLAQR